MSAQLQFKSRAGTVRRMDLWSLLVWTYQRQKAHVILKGAKGMCDWGFSLDPCLDITPKVHGDAAKVHAAVIEVSQVHGVKDDRMREIFGGGVAENNASLLIKAAVEGNHPDPSGIIPHLEPVINRIGSGASHVVDGVWDVCASFDLRASEEALLTKGRGTFRRAGWLYDVDLGKIMHRRKRRQNLTTAGGKRHKDGRDGHGTGFRVFMPYCPVEQWPSQFMVDVTNEVYREWYTAMARLLDALKGVEFDTVEISGFNAPPPNDDTLSPWMRAAMASLEELRGRADDERIEADARTLWESLKGDGCERWFDLPQDKRTEYRRRAATALRGGEQERIVAGKKDADV